MLVNFNFTLKSKGVGYLVMCCVKEFVKWLFINSRLIDMSRISLTNRYGTEEVVDLKLYYYVYQAHQD